MKKYKLELTHTQLEVLEGLLSVYGDDISDQQEGFWYANEKRAFTEIIKKVAYLWHQAQK